MSRGVDDRAAAHIKSIVDDGAGGPRPGARASASKPRLIVIPANPSSLLAMSNAKQFLEGGKFVAADQSADTVVRYRAGDCRRSSLNVFGAQVDGVRSIIRSPDGTRYACVLASSVRDSEWDDVAAVLIRLQLVYPIRIV